MQSTTEIVVEFNIVVDEDQADMAHQAATSLQSSTNPLSLSIAGQTGKTFSHLQFLPFSYGLHLIRLQRNAAY